MSDGAAAWLPETENSEPFDCSTPLASRPNVPTVTIRLSPRISRGDLVITLTTPVSALAPHTADAGPRITSICLISLVFTGRKSQATKPKKS